MNTPAISAAPSPDLAPRRRGLARLHTLTPHPARPGPVARAGWEILAGVVLLLGWTILWVFFLDAVVSPAAALHGVASPAAARRAAAAPSLMGEPLPAR